MDTKSGSVRTLDDIETELRTRMEEIGRHQAEVLCLLREADRMQAHLVDGARTMADWTAARLDLSPESARTLVTCARTLHDLPDLESALEAGMLSFDRTVELARAAIAGVDLSDHRNFDIAGLQRVIASRRQRTRSEDREAFTSRYLVIQPSLDRSLWRMHGQLGGTDGAVVEAALDARADRITQGVDRRPPLAQRRADALVDLCTTNGHDSRSEPLVSIFLDGHGATINGHLPVGADTVDEALCTGSAELVDISDPDRPLARGATTKMIPRRLRRTVFHRDGGRCVIDGCTSRYRIQPHHVIPRSEHGPTSLDNLITLCWYHHHVVVHGHRRRIDPTSPPQRRRFLRRHGRSPPG